jgi:hypothetical protein
VAERAERHGGALVGGATVIAFNNLAMTL